MCAFKICVYLIKTYKKKISISYQIFISISEKYIYFFKHSNKAVKYALLVFRSKVMDVF